MKSTTGGRDEDWFPWDEEHEGSRPAHAPERPWPGLSADPGKEPAGGDTALAAPVPETGPATDADLAPAAPLSDAGPAANDTDVSPAPAAADAAPATGDVEAVTEEAPADTAPPAGRAPATVTDIPVALRGIPGPWDEAVAPASSIPTVSDLPTMTDAPAAAGRPGDPGQSGHPGHPPVSSPMPEGSGHTLALAVPGAAGTPGEPPAAAHELPPPPYTPGPGHPRPPAGPPAPPTAKRPGGPSGKTTAALVAAGSAIVVAAAITLVFSRLGGSPDAPCSGNACAKTRQKSTAALTGPRLRYRTVDRETGYFEGTITIVNPGESPMNGWTLSFTYPGADIHNVWEAVLQRRGETVTIVNAMTAAPIAPGERFEVQFGGAGRPAMPTGCRLNNAPCVFVR